MPDQPLLKFEQATVRLPPPRGKSSIELVIHPGEVIQLDAPEGETRRCLADLAHGLVAPLEGEVSFQGTAWTLRGAEAACQARLRIGRYFSAPAWISNLDVDENVLLSATYSGARGSELHSEAARLVKDFGLEELPTSRPAACSARALGAAQLVRLFLGRPELVLLEAPEEELAPEALGGLRRQLSQAVADGAGVLWLSASRDVLDDDDDSMPQATVYTLAERGVTRVAPLSP